MTDRDYTEVQLSGKQLVFLFISAVVLAVVIFLLGVAVGRGVPGSATDVPVSADVGAESVPVPAGEDSPPAVAQELSYHDLLAGGGSASPASEPTPAPLSPITEPVAAPAPPPAASAAGGWLLQIGAYSTRQAADRQVAALKKLGVPVFVLVPAEGASDRFFRVRVGPYGSEVEAEAARTTLVREGFSPQVVR